MSIEAEMKFSKAKSQLVLNQIFFAILAMGREMVENDKWCERMATNGRDIFWNRKFVDSITTDELKGVIAHEVMHVAYRHMLRIRGRNSKLWNIACDIVINDQLYDAGFKLPKPHIDPTSSEFKKYKGWDAEAIYADLYKNAPKIKVRFDSNKKGGDGDKDDEVLWGGVVEATDGDGNPLSPAEISEIEHSIKEQVMAAARAAKSIGKLPGFLEGLIEATSKPKVDWQSYIPNWVKSITPDDYSWQRANRKMLANHGVYMPRIKLNGSGHGILSVDTSGSVSDEELVWYVNEIVGLIEACKPDKLTIIQHDAVITRTDIWEHGMDFSKLHIKGRGGTNISPSFRFANSHEEEVNWMICFTDMGIPDYPRDAPDFPVLWCATGPMNAPFGTYLDLRGIR